MLVRYPIRRRDIRLGQLAAEITALVGRAVVLTVDETEPDDEPDQLAVVDETGQPVAVDPARLDTLIATHTPAPPPRSSAEQALDDFDTALTPAGKLAALRGYVAREAGAAEQRRRARPVIPGLVDRDRRP